MSKRYLLLLEDGEVTGTDAVSKEQLDPSTTGHYIVQIIDIKTYCCWDWESKWVPIPESPSD